MTSRPAAPESETPETDAAIVIGDGVIGPRTHTGFQIKFELNKEWVFADLARSLERRLSLAQTEIKEYQAKHTAIMREADRRYDELVQDIEQGFMQGAYTRLKNLQSAECELAEARTRIAELEKLLGRWLTGPHVINAPLSLINETKYAALKDRA